MEKLQKFPMQKFFFRSKVNWVGIVTAVAGIVQALLTLLSTNHGDVKSWVFAAVSFVLGALTIILRTFFITDTAPAPAKS